MVNKARTARTRLAMSKLAQVDPLTPRVLPADFDGVKTQTLNVTVPGLELVLNAGMVGGGNGHPDQADGDYLGHTTANLSDRLNTKVFARCIRRQLAGTVDSDPVEAASTAYDHIIHEDDSDDLVLPGTSFICKYGGADMLLHNMTHSALTVQRPSDGNATFSQDMVGNGNFDFLSELVGNPFAGTVPAVVKQNYMHRAKGMFAYLYDGDAQPINFAALGRFVGTTFSFNNNPRLNQRDAGDPFRKILAAGPPIEYDTESGAFVREIRRDATPQLTVSASIRVDAGKAELVAQLNKKEIFDLTYFEQGRKITGTPFYHEAELTVMRSVIQTVAPGDDQGDALWVMNFIPLQKDGEVGIVKARIRNNMPTLN